MQLKKTLPLAATVLLLPSLAMAQEAEVVADAMEAVTALNTEMVFIMNSLLFLVGGFLVFFMAAGFCMLETGLVRSKNATMQATKNVALFSLAAIAYFLVGFNLMYPLGDWVVEGWLGGISPTVLEPVGVALEDVDDIEYASIGSDFIFQLMFCAAVASIVSGAVAERIKLWPFLIFVVILTGIIYPIQASWSWGEGFLDEMGFSDFAGSSIVHAAGGWAALAGVIVLGARYGKYGKDGKVTVMPGSNLPLATLGMFILWLGWFGFNGGSQLAMGTISDVADVSRIFANTNTAASGGAVAALILSTIVYKKPDLTMVLNGALAGLVSITAEPLTPSLGAATLIGAVGGVIVVLTIPLLDKFKIDDVVGAIPVHLFAGLWGTMAVPLTNSDANFVTQFVGMAAIGIFMFFASLVVWLILKAVMGIRISDEDQVTGLDKTEMGMEAYPEFSNS
ncbi:ammonium transporter [Roseinatronobacter bogoriensis]|uniref:Ammonium transporter n=1 Tax=Roseinatronobacter bogoriensis subsp. barguzinensis TaxID=441209 RepID=A0A2K8KF69_9RHOB|nr:MULTISPECIES: ammonium transporter [Rhodobaca]ATX67646.1 ammonium transporter [Rhodobaca barguzinensis]MBB4208780.1 Amt family ammonium transporter [Rhodobaca bogoriensis DSM 18756]TDW37952.1 Amt family ammonium transporter [Rhodobaca barguzinensis]TDY69878.1 ammonium transporter [Rhodobaca bogoriensis DSM 18756]